MTRRSIAALLGREESDDDVVMQRSVPTRDERFGTIVYPGIGDGLVFSVRHS
jgi:hypothetical protein